MSGGIEKVSAIFTARKKSPSNAASTGLETPDAGLSQNGPVENVSVRGNGKKKAGWLSPDYCQSRTFHLDPGLIEANRCLAYLDSVPGAEAYRILRTQILQRTRSTGGNLIMVTSVLPGEGKTLTAINLAFTFAREYQHTVLLLDGDLKKQSIHKYLGCNGDRGLIDYLLDGAHVPELITYPGIEKMTLISGGRSYKESAEILGSPRMRELISDMKGRYPERYAIIDAPSILTGADVLTLAPLVDHVIVVVRQGKTSMDDARKAIKFLPKEKVLGFVLNRCNK
ncbi:MAG: P-loop NTPase [Nitrospirae bacterium]|nr:P-loop NTPase [Nitrospirota bacterium]